VGEPNEMEVSIYDVAPVEEDVVERVRAFKAAAEARVADAAGNLEMAKNLISSPSASAHYIDRALRALLAAPDAHREDGDDVRVPINIKPATKERLYRYLMDEAPRGMGYSAFIDRALDVAAPDAPLEESTPEFWERREAMLHAADDAVAPDAPLEDE